VKKNWQICRGLFDWFLAFWNIPKSVLRIFFEQHSYVSELVLWFFRSAMRAIHYLVPLLITAQYWSSTAWRHWDITGRRFCILNFELLNPYEVRCEPLALTNEQPTAKIHWTVRVGVVAVVAALTNNCYLVISHNNMFVNSATSSMYWWIKRENAINISTYSTQFGKQTPGPLLQGHAVRIFGSNDKWIFWQIVTNYQSWDYVFHQEGVNHVCK
jgi:hypothetical protein